MTPAAALPAKRRPSLARRAFRTVAVLLGINVLFTFVAVELLADKFEVTLLHRELAQEVQAMKGQITQAQVQTLLTALVTALYVPDGEVTDALPPIFVGRTPPFAGEVEVGTRTYLVVLERVADPPGVLHLALDISFLEDHERWMQQMTLAVGAAMLVFGLLLARIGTRRVVQPLVRLSRAIGGLRPDRPLEAVHTDYEDRELAQIAQAVDHLLKALDAHAKREKELVSLASHELRTPVAVIAGALDVLARRATLCDDDARTVARIQRATDGMRADIEALLAVARPTSPRHSAETAVPVDLAANARSVIRELEYGAPTDAGRARLSVVEPVPAVAADPALVRMLLRNLIQNALRHTPGGVDVEVRSEGVTISDRGPGLPPQVLGQLAVGRSAPDGGLGLFIVQLICERLGWRLDIRRSDAGGTVLALQVSGVPSAAHPSS